MAIAASPPLPCFVSRSMLSASSSTRYRGMGQSWQQIPRSLHCRSHRYLPALAGRCKKIWNLARFFSEDWTPPEAVHSRKLPHCAQKFAPGVKPKCPIIMELYSKNPLSSIWGVSKPPSGIMAVPWADVREVEAAPLDGVLHATRGADHELRHDAPGDCGGGQQGEAVGGGEGHTSHTCSILFTSSQSPPLH